MLVLSLVSSPLPVNLSPGVSTVGEDLQMVLRTSDRHEHRVVVVLAKLSVTIPKMMSIDASLPAMCQRTQQSLTLASQRHVYTGMNILGRIWVLSRTRTPYPDYMGACSLSVYRITRHLQSVHSYPSISQQYL
jgi:hypothetical protein